MEKIGKEISLFFLSSLIMMTKAVLLIPKGTCRYYPSCSEYAREAILTRSLPTAITIIVKRVLKCTPFSPGGYDPVQKQKERHDFCE
jgi:putative membrane protein insertion efficiency factor